MNSDKFCKHCQLLIRSLRVTMNSRKFYDIKKSAVLCGNILIATAILYILYITLYNARSLKSINNSHRTTVKPTNRSKYANLIDCYKIGLEVPKDGVKLIDISESAKQPIPGKTIIFHETSCLKNGEMKLGSRQLCSIESAAKNNPNFDIFVIFSSPRYIFLDSIQKEIQRLQLNYKNIFFRNSDIWKYVENSSAASKFLESDKLFESAYLPVHISDFLRLISLWKYGAIYMDSDIILNRSLEELGPSFGGIEEHGENLNNGLLRLAPNGTGHLLGEMFIKDFVDNFKPLEWAANGPQMITRVLKRFCKENNLSKITNANCEGFTIYPRESFWAVSWTEAKSFFEPNQFNRVKNITKNSFGIHVFNHITKDIKNKVESKNIYNLYASAHCPVTFANIKDLM